jgi:Ca-activated chloride channel family protein
MIVFLTDGLPTVGETDLGSILKRVAKKNKAGVRIFPFGVGYDVNTHLLDKLSEENRGTVEYIKPEEDIEDKISVFYSKVSNPILSDITLDFGHIKTKDVYPNHLPDIFDGSQLVIFGKYNGTGHAAIKLTGYVGESKKTFVYEGRFRKRNRKNAFIPRLWATRKIAYLLSEIKVHGYNDELVEEIIALSKEHGIITPYTSYLVLEDNQVALRGNQDVRVMGQRPISGGAKNFYGEGKTQDLHVRGGRSEELKRAALKSYVNPSSGKAATEFSQDVARSKEQSVLVVPESESIKYIGDKTFYLMDEGWVDEDFKEEMKVTEIKYLSDQYFKLINKEPEVGKILSLGKKITFVYEGKAYRIIE